MFIKRIVVAGAESSVEKIMVAIGLMAAYKALVFSIQGFKYGPDVAIIEGVMGIHRDFEIVSVDFLCLHFGATPKHVLEFS